MAKSPYVKKVVPGVIEGNATSSGGGVRLSSRGVIINLKALLIDGSTVQQIHVITTSSNKEKEDNKNP